MYANLRNVMKHIQFEQSIAWHGLMDTDKLTACAVHAQNNIKQTNKMPNLGREYLFYKYLNYIRNNMIPK